MSITSVNFISRVNDVITSVNGVNTVDVTHEQSVAALKRAGNTVQLMVKRARTPNTNNIIEINLVKGNRGKTQSNSHSVSHSIIHSVNQGNIQ